MEKVVKLQMGKSQKVQMGKSYKVQIEKEKKLKKTLNQRTFLIFYWDIWEYIFIGVEKKLKNILEEEQVRPNHKFSLICLLLTNKKWLLKLRTNKKWLLRPLATRK
jgi:hypothetical protein